MVLGVRVGPSSLVGQPWWLPPLSRGRMFLTATISMSSHVHHAARYIVDATCKESLSLAAACRRNMHKICAQNLPGVVHSSAFMMTLYLIPDDAIADTHTQGY